MENSRNSDSDRSRSAAERRRQRRFDSNALADVFRDALKLSPDVSLCVAYSGGMDSHVLLHAVAGLRAAAPWEVSALHIDHGLQPESRRWSQHCATVCVALNVPYQCERIAVPDIETRGLEDAARRARYAALATLLRSDAVLLTAHHRDDQAETLLLQLLRGAGVPGLAAMPSIVPFARGRIARPLLAFERAALARYAGDNGLEWIEDPSNFDVGPARNFMRRHLWPVLGARWPGATERLATSAEHLAQAGKLLDELGRSDAAACADADAGLKVSALLTFSPERQVNLLRYWIRAQTGATPPESALREIGARTAQTPRTRHAAVKWGGVEVRRYRDRLLVVRPELALPRDWEVSWDLSGVLEIPGAGWRLSAQITDGGGISEAGIAGRDLRVRLRRGGEHCRLRGHRREVKKLLQEAGIPPWERGHWPLIYVDNDLVAIGDRWVCEPYAARPDEKGWVLRLRRVTEV